MNEALEHLATMDGVSGMCLHRGGIIKWQRLPDTLSNDRAASLCSAVSRAFAAYAAAERQLTQAWFEFGSQSLLVVARKPEDPHAAPEVFLTFLLRDRSVAPSAIKGALACLQSVV